MSRADSVDITIANFFSRIAQEEKLGSSVQAELRRLADNGQLADQIALEKALQEDDATAGEAKTARDESCSGPS